MNVNQNIASLHYTQLSLVVPFSVSMFGKVLKPHKKWKGKIGGNKIKNKKKPNHMT